MEWREDMCIVSGSYQAIDGHPARTLVELWCRARAGHSVLLLVEGLRPYIDVAQPGRPKPAAEAAESLEFLRQTNEVMEIAEPVEKWTPLGMKPHWRVYVRQPFLVRGLRRRIESEWEVSSADILFVQRLLLDADLGPHISAGGKILWAGERAPDEIERSSDRVIAAESIRDVGGSGLYPVDLIVHCNISDLERTEPFPAPFVSFSYDLETSVKYNTILCAAAVIDRAGERTTHEFRGDESDIMEGLTRLVREEDPDIITGYNIDNFDLPRILDRSELNSKRSRSNQAAMFGWGRVPIVESEIGTRSAGRVFPQRQQNRVWRIQGRIPFDAWWQARQTLRPQRESLRYVSNLLWPSDSEKQKLDVDASQMDMEWANRPDEVMEYCVRDTILPLDILDKLQSVARKEALASVSLTTVEVAAAGTTSNWIDSLTVRLADRQGVAVPTTKRGPRRRDQIAGGYVHEVDAGIHPWVAVLDFKSMYPSIMIAKNICSTTLVRDGRVDDSHFVSPMDTRFVAKSEREGLVPQLLADLMSRRDKHKVALAEAKARGDEDAAFLQDQLQYAVKILMNSFYGVFASSFYRFTHPDLGASITAWARHNIRKIIADLGEEGYSVVYSDTDSIFVRAPVEEGAPISRPEELDPTFSDWSAAKDATISFGNRLAERFTKEGAELEFETGLSAFFSHGAKKRYVGRVIWPREEMLVRGYEIRRTDSFSLLTKIMTEMFELILANEPWAAVEMTKKAIDDVKSKRVEATDLVISRSCKGKLRKDGTVDFASIYDRPDSLPYVRAAKKRIAKGLAFTPGMKVGYIVTDGKSSPMEVEPWLVDEIGEAPPDYDSEYYAKRLATALGRITEAFGWDDKELLIGSRQQSIFDF